MNGQSDLWVNFWSKEKYVCNYSCDDRFGTNNEPDSSIWCASFFETVKDRLDKPFVILDWGAGDGRFFAFLCRRYEEFSYYGCETNNDHGAFCIDRARGFFGEDKRFNFDYIGSALSEEAIGKADIITLGSVATHLSPEKMNEYYDKFMPAFDRGAVMVASFFFGEPLLTGGGAYNSQDCYMIAVHSFDQFQEAMKSHGLIGEEKEKFLAQGTNLHRIVRIQKA